MPLVLEVLTNNSQWSSRRRVIIHRTMEWVWDQKKTNLYKKLQSFKLYKQDLEQGSRLNTRTKIPHQRRYSAGRSSWFYSEVRLLIWRVCQWLQVQHNQQKGIPTWWASGLQDTNYIRSVKNWIARSIQIFQWVQCLRSSCVIWFPSSSVPWCSCAARAHKYVYSCSTVEWEISRRRSQICQVVQRLRSRIQDLPRLSPEPRHEQQAPSGSYHLVESTYDPWNLAVYRPTCRYTEASAPQDIHQTTRCSSARTPYGDWESCTRAEHRDLFSVMQRESVRTWKIRAYHGLDP